MKHFAPSLWELPGDDRFSFWVCLLNQPLVLLVPLTWTKAQGGRTGFYGTYNGLDLFYCICGLTIHQSWDSRKKDVPLHSHVSSKDKIPYKSKSRRKQNRFDSKVGRTETAIPGTYSSVFPYIFLVSAANHLLNPIQQGCCFFELRSSDKKK